jgi:hypothetical protein
MAIRVRWRKFSIWPGRKNVTIRSSLAAATQLLDVQYVAQQGAFDLAKAKGTATKPKGDKPDSNTGDFAGAYANAPTPRQTSRTL